MRFFDQFILYRALDVKYGHADVMDLISEDSDTAKSLKLKTVCFQLFPSAFESLEDTCALLGISKRRFLAIVVDDALDRVSKIIAKADLTEFGEPTVTAKFSDSDEDETSFLNSEEKL